MYSPETQTLIATYKQKAIAGTITLDEMRDAVRIMRQERLTAGEASRGARAKRSTKVVRSADDMLNELGPI